MSKTEQVLNIKTGKMENCTVGAGCRKHSHAATKVLTAMKDKTSKVAASLKSGEKQITVKPYGKSKEEVITVIEPKLFATDRDYDKGFVIFERDEVSFMDMDKLTHALGHTLKGVKFKPFEHTVIFKGYAETPTHRIFEAHIEL